MSYNAKIYQPQGADQLIVADGGTIVIRDGGILEVESGGEISIASGGKITAAGTQAATIANVAITATLTGVDTGTDMTAVQAATIVADLNSIKTKMNALIAAAKGVGIIAAS